MGQHRDLDINWRLVWGSILVGLALAASIVGLSLRLLSEAGPGSRQGLIAGLLLAPLLAAASGGLIAYKRAKNLKLLHVGLVVAISFALILLLLCGLTIFGGQLIGTVR